MSLPFVRMRIRLSAFYIVPAALLATSCAMAQQTARPVSAPPPAAAPEAGSRADANNSIAELRHLMDTHQLTELRTTYNGTYGTSLLFDADKLTYYVALFHEKEFWRVIHTDSVNEAESLYKAFVGQTEKLAQVDIDTIRLQAGKRYTEHLVAVNQQRLQYLQQDAAHQRAQAQQVAVAQQQAQQQAVSLTGDLRQSSSQLDSVQKQIRLLEQEQSNPNLVLPALAPPQGPAPASSAQGAPAPAESTGN